jgi:hypothetical protein
MKEPREPAIPAVTCELRSNDTSRRSECHGIGVCLGALPAGGSDESGARSLGESDELLKMFDPVAKTCLEDLASQHIICQ